MANTARQGFRTHNTGKNFNAHHPLESAVAATALPAHSKILKADSVAEVQTVEILNRYAAESDSATR